MRRNVPKVTVVVPVYKVEKYLNECVDSILRQTLKSLEIILIDDGSPDRCGEIIDTYAKQDKRVVAVHQKNKGYSAAVNLGIEMARGEYIGIIESDDWIEPNMYELLYKNAKKNRTDVTKATFYNYNSTAAAGMQNIVFRNPSNTDLLLAPDGVFTAAEWPKIMAFHASIWSSIYKASFVKKIKIPESAGASYQDFPFMASVMSKAKRITVVKRPLVHWRNDPKQGNSTSANGEKLLLMGKNTLLSQKILKDSGKYPVYREAFLAHAMWCNFGFFERTDRKHRKEYYNILREIFSELKDDDTFSYILFTDTDRKQLDYYILPRYGYQRYKLHRIVFRVRCKILRVARTFLPTYRAVNFIKEQNWDIERQIETMSNTMENLQNRLDQLSEKKK